MLIFFCFMLLAKAIREGTMQRVTFSNPSGGRATTRCKEKNVKTPFGSHLTVIVLGMLVLWRHGRPGRRFRSRLAWLVAFRRRGGCVLGQRGRSGR